MNVDDVARILHLSRNTIYKLAKTGELTSLKTGRKLRFTQTDVDEYLSRSKQSDPRKRFDVNSGGLVLPGKASVRHEGVVFAGNDLVADVIANYASAAGFKIVREHESSYCGLVNLYSGAIDATLVHLWDARTNTFNIPFVQRLAPGMSMVLIRILKRRTGFAVKKGNPKGLGSWGSLLHEDVRIASRKKGYASRILLDEKVTFMDINTAALSDRLHEFDRDVEIISAIESGACDVAVADEDEVAYSGKLDFVPLQNEWLDLAIAKTPRTRGFMRLCQEAFSEASVISQISSVTKGCTSNLGAIVYEC